MARWFEINGPDSDVVVSSRIRLARNLTNYNFSLKLAEADADRMIDELLDKIGRIEPFAEYTPFQFRRLSECQRHAMEERHVISSFLLGQNNAAGMVSPDENISLMFNEEDHIRIQAFAAGRDMQKAYSAANTVDDRIGSVIGYAFHPQYGYLTTCLSSVGTGMRAMYMLHLPGLSGTGQLAGIIREAGRFGLSIRGVYGDGATCPGDIYRISNQTTLGMSENELIDNLDNIVQQIIDQERMARQQYVNHKRVAAEDAAYRSYGVLKYARKLSLRDGLVLLSELRMGLALGLFNVEAGEDFSVYQMMIGIQPNNLQLAGGNEMSQEEIEVERSHFIRENLPLIQ